MVRFQNKVSFYLAVEEFRVHPGLNPLHSKLKYEIHAVCPACSSSEETPGYKSRRREQMEHQFDSILDTMKD